MARIAIYIARHLCTAPRPQKEAEALAAAGHDVSVHGVSYNPTYSARDMQLAAGRPWRWEPVADFAAHTSAHRLAWFACRLRHRAAKFWFNYTGLIAADVWSNATRVLANHAARQAADLTIVHAEGGLWFGRQMQRAGARVGVDFEDWFSRDLTPEQQRNRPVAALAALEHDLLQNCRYRMSTSHALANALGKAYGTPAPSVIYNSFPAGLPPPGPIARPAVSLHWFSLVMGPDRGLESLATALPLLIGDWQLNLRGDTPSGYRQRWLDLLPAALHPRVHFHPTVPTGELPAHLAEHDIGLALDVSAISSRNLTITNKFFHYLHAGLAVAASDTAGHREGLALAPAAGALFPAGDATALAGILNKWITDRTALYAARRAARTAFECHFAHERQQHIYAELAAQALGG